MPAIIRIFFLLFMMSGCTNLNLSPTELILWVDDSRNNLVKTKIIGDYEFRLQYCPVDYKIAKLISEGRCAIDLVDSMRNQLNSLEYFTLGLTTQNGRSVVHELTNSDPTFAERLEYFNTVAENDIYLVVGNDTLGCALYQFEQTFGISKFDNILIAFEKRDSLYNYDRQLVFQERSLDIGKIKIIIDKDDITDIPKLKL